MRLLANPLSASRSRAAFAALLVLCLLFAQALGLAHAIAHANFSSEAATTPLANDPLFDHAKSASDCAAFDAVALGSGVHSADFALPVAASGAEAIVIPHAHVASQRFIAYFNSRAPPPQA